MKKYILNFSILISAVIYSAVISNAAAQSSDIPSDALSKLTYPIIELGGCKDRAECKIYCDDSANTAACVSYGEKYNLFSQEDLQIAKKFVAAGSKGPGDCNGKEECKTYCDDKAHIDECVAYAESNGLMSEQELQKAKKVQAAIKNGVKFPACNNKKECDTYCEDSSHMEECITFAKEAGFLSDKELANTEKVLTAIKQGVNPPACKGKEACDAYCAEESNVAECTNFAVAAGLVTSDEAKIIKETGGKGPGGCKNKSECDSYCGNEANRETCMNFAIEHNIPQPQPPQQPGQQKQDGIAPGNGTGNGGGNGGPDSQGGGTGPGNGAGQGQGGPGMGAGPGNGAGQGGGGQTNIVSPTKCIADCETVGKNCIAALDTETKKCASDGSYCRQVTCSNLNGVGNQVTAEDFYKCNDTQCTPTETSCHAVVTEKNSACTTTKDVCVMNCQKASKPTKPTQPVQSGQPTQPVQPTQPNQPSQPTQPSKPTKPTPPTQSGTPSQPTPPTLQTPPTQPPTGKCGDGICGRMEQADPTLCPEDCGGQ